MQDEEPFLLVEHRTGQTAKRVQLALGALGVAGTHGLTCFDLEVAYPREPGGDRVWHHGKWSATLSVLHEDRVIEMLKDRRGREDSAQAHIYVLPQYVAGRETRPHARNKPCPHCGLYPNERVS